MQYPENAQLGANVVPMQVDYAGDARSGLWVLQIASGICPANRLFEFGEPAARTVDRAPAEKLRCG